jgi:hypothetical protein
MKRKNDCTKDCRFRMKTIKLFLDDVREPYMVEHCVPPSDWTIVRSVKAAKEVLETRQVSHISLDHDLGNDQPTGYDLCKWMSENFAWPDNVYVHSANPIGAKRMLDEYRSYIARQVEKKQRRKRHK